MRSILLARVSSEEQEDNLSIPAQIRRIREYADRHGMVYGDEDIIQIVETASKNAVRVKFHAILNKISKGNEKVALVVDCVDRVTRNFGDAVRMDELRRSGKLEIHFIREGLIITQEANSSEIIRWDMGVMFAKSYSMQISDNVKRSIKEKIERGELLTKAPFGYKNITLPNGDKDIVFDEVESEVVKKIFKWYTVSGLSIEQVRVRLKNDEHRILTKSVVAFILSNKFYIGTATYHKKNFEYRHRYPQLITYSTFKKAEDIRHGRQKYDGVVSPEGPLSIFKGFLKCGVCGYSVMPENHRGRIFYRCSQHGGKHGAKYIKEAVLVEKLASAFSDLNVPPDKLQEILKNMKEINRDKLYYSKSLLNDLHAKQAKLLERMSKIYDDKLDGVITEDFYRMKFSGYNSEISEIQETVEKVSNANKNFYASAAYLLKMASMAEDLYRCSREADKRALINSALLNITWDGENLRWDYKKPFDWLVQYTKSGKWGGLLDATRTPTVEIITMISEFGDGIVQLLNVWKVSLQLQ